MKSHNSATLASTSTGSTSVDADTLQGEDDQESKDIDVDDLILDVVEDTTVAATTTTAAAAISNQGLAKEVPDRDTVRPQRSTSHDSKDGHVSISSATLAAAVASSSANGTGTSTTRMSSSSTSTEPSHLHVAKKPASLPLEAQQDTEIDVDDLMEQDYATMNVKPSASASNIMASGTTLAPQSREARIQHKMRQQQQQQASTASTRSSNASIRSSNASIRSSMTLQQEPNSMATTTTGISNSSNNQSSFTTDHQAALALARQDIQQKANQNPNQTPADMAANLGAVAASARRRKTHTNQNNSINDNDTNTNDAANNNTDETNEAQAESNATTATATAVARTPSNNSNRSIPVGAFRIQPSQSGRLAVTNAALEADLRGSSIHHQSNTSSVQTSPPPPIVESSLVIESVLVVEEEEGQDQHRSRRSHHRRTSRNAETVDEEQPQTRQRPSEEAPQTTVEASSSYHHHTTIAANATTTTTSHRTNNNNNDYFQDESAAAVMVVTAETPTLNDSVWTLLKSRKGRWGIILIIALTATFTVLGVTVWKNNGSKIIDEISNIGVHEEAPSEAPSMVPSETPSTGSPTEAPTTLQPTAAPTTRPFIPKDDLPVGTINAIITNPNGPQAKAWRWLQLDIQQRTGQEFAPNLLDGTGAGNNSTRFLAMITNTTNSIEEADQFVQRFALMTLFYATNGEGWTFQRYWEDHDTPECDWWPHVADVSWPYDKGPAVCESDDNVGFYTRLLLSDNSLEGTLPNEIGLLSHLTSIDVSGNPGLVGSIPESVCDALQRDNDPIQVVITCNAGLVCECGCQCQ
ncbi:expressed unknown protein [Seminavis robusta]|uniref:Uncharacterized protein n=1 Tax=Seminavis robusta TaxID=568900 RepID=A0A9N8EDZ3_9STRA|nr:expressed unknown protein [Seminavis robusta]|eukprot:Sro984_g227900.1 n/a (809) ;mRNA; r:12057-14483